MNALRPYTTLAVAGFRRESRYRLAALAGLVTNSLFGFVKAAILGAAVTSAGGTLAGYTAGSIGAYIWISQGLLGAITLTGVAEIGERVLTGEVVVDLLRPVDLQLSHLCGDLGRSAFTVFPRLIPVMVVGAVTVGYTLPTTAAPYLFGVVSIVLGTVLSFLGRFAVSMTAFWILETRGVRTFYGVVGTFLSGLFVPVALFPGWLRTIAYATPFPSTLQAPVDILSGRITGGQTALALAAQVGWVLLIGAAGRLLLAAGTRRLEVQGG